MFYSALVLTFGAVITATLPAGAPSIQCNGIPGLVQMMSTSKIRFLFLGESHGTSEVAPFLEDVVCNLSKDRPILVALEWSERELPAIEKYLESADRPADKTALLTSPIWSRAVADGRSSRAMLHLLEQLRQLRAGGRKIEVVPVQPAGPFFGVSQEYYEVAFANNLVKAAMSNREYLVVGLLGSRHAAKSSDAASDFQPAVGHLPNSDVISIQFRSQGGFAWNCQSGGCGPHPIARATQSPRGITLTPGDKRFDGYFSAGMSSVASDPVK